MKPLGYLFLFFLFLSCKKENTTSSPVHNPDKTITYTVIDQQTHFPVDSAMVQFAYENSFNDTKYTDVDGRASFTIPGDWIVNEAHITKPNYCWYTNTYLSGAVALNQTVNLNHYAYLRIHVQNVAPAVASDHVEIGFPSPASYTTIPDVFYGLTDTTYIKEALAGNISVTSSVFNGVTFDHSNFIPVITTGGDTSNVSVDF
jgi:hypothetical protein